METGQKSHIRTGVFLHASKVLVQVYLGSWKWRRRFARRTVGTWLTCHQIGASLLSRLQTLTGRQRRTFTRAIPFLCTGKALPDQRVPFLSNFIHCFRYFLGWVLSC